MLFGGQTTSANRFADTWEWTAAGPGGGGSWSLVANSGPPRTAAAGMAYDSRRQRTVLFGGTTDAGLTNQTWEWDGSTWTLMQPVLSPPPMEGVMAFDPVRGRSVLLSTLWNGNGFHESWEYDGVTWLRFLDGPIAYVRYEHSLAFDTSRSMMVAMVGDPPALWERASTGWHEVATDDRPFHYMASYRITFDSVLQRPVIVNPDRSGHLCTWSWNASAGRWWIMNTSGPSATQYYAAAYDAAGSQVLLFGGRLFGTSAAWSGDTLLARTDVVSGPVLTDTAPRSATLMMGDPYWPPTVLHAQAVGSGDLTYRWRCEGTEVTDGGAYSGATTPHLTIDPRAGPLIGGPHIGGSYDAVVTDSCGSSIRPATGVGTHCYADCDYYAGNPQLTANDFACFLKVFTSGHWYANCDGSTVAPVLTANDFQCFINCYAKGCP